MTQRTCADCGTDISKLSNAARRCPECCVKIMRAAGLTPLVPYPGAHTPWKSRCLACGEEVTPRLVNVQRLGRGCNPCGLRTQAATQRTPEAEAVIVMLNAGLEPLEPYPGGQRNWLCRCMVCGDEVRPQYGNIRVGWGGCKTCGIWKRAQACRKPENEAVEILRSVGLEPLEPYRSRHKPWRSRCLACGQEVGPLLANIQAGNGGCVWCTRHAVPEGEAIAAMRSAGLEPLAPYPGSGTAWPCRCLRCGRAPAPTFSAIQAGGGCRWCGRGVPLPGEAEEFMHRRGLEPLESYPGASAPWSCQCRKCGRKTSPCYNAVQRNPGGCQWCRERGFKSYEIASVYLVTHTLYGATKIGITDADGGRVTLHRRYGWEVVTKLVVPGEVAQAVERGVLRWWRKDLCLPPYLGPQEMPQGGWTETVESCEIDVPETVRRMHRGASG